MAEGQLETVLAELVRQDDDPDGRRDVLDRASRTLLHRPALGGRLIAQLCATAETDPQLEALTDLLGAALDAARMASESGKTRGDTFLQTVTDAVDLAAGQGRLSPFHRLLLASAWTRNGLTAPTALEVSADDLVLSDSTARPADSTEADAMLDDLFRTLIAQSEGDALTLHAALTETFPAMPPEMRGQVIAWSVAQPDPIHATMACFWLLDPAAPLRLAAARALADRAADGTLSADLAGKLATLRSWMPGDEARAAIDTALRSAMRAGIAPEPATQRWIIHRILATLPDGGGAQSIMIALQSGGRRKTAMLLLKHGHGIKDAYAIPCASATEQKALLQRITDETGAVAVPEAWLPRALSMALADGLAADLPPSPGLVEIAALCGLTALRPEPESTAALVAGLPGADRIRALAVQARGRLINASDDWCNRHEIVESWFEDSDLAHAALEDARSPRAVDKALWNWLETRRDVWARHIARGADVLAAADHPDADSFTATAMALLEGRDLKKIPVMADVHEQTAEAWVFDDPDVDPTMPMSDWVEQEEAVAPQPERAGELARLLKDAAVTPDWIDGFLMSITLAPKLIAPNRWLPEILGSAIGTLPPDRIQRFADLILMRANGCVAQADEPNVFRTAMMRRSTMEMRDWATGFSYACDQFRASWPAKSTAADDRAMQARVSDAMTSGFSAPEAKTLSVWVAARHARNIGA